jgi:hypothetical protein
MKKIFVTTLILLLALGSCTKKDVDCPVSVNSVSGTYKITSMKYKQTSGSAETEMIDILIDACEKDDLYIFLSGQVFNYQDAGTVCSPNGSYASTWTLNGNLLVINTEPETIQSFDCINMVTFATDVFTAGDRITLTYVKQ